MITQTIILSISLLILLFSFTAEGGPSEDPCSVYTTCKDCVEVAFCGWCEDIVEYADGLNGTHCASVNASMSNKATQWTCPFFFQTASCKDPSKMWKCDNSSWICKQTAPGEGKRIEECEKDCLAPTYLCNTTNMTNPVCEETSPGHGTSKDVCESYCGKMAPISPVPASPSAPGSIAHTYECNNKTWECVRVDPGHGESLDVCLQECKKPPPPYKCDPDKLVCYPDKDGPSKPICEETCGKPRNVTPAVLTGVWRGFEINADYHKGEWDMRVDEKTGALIILRPDNTIFSQGFLRTYGDELWIVDAQESPETRVRGIYTMKNEPETTVLQWAIGFPGGPPPSSFDETMYVGKGHVFIFAKCLVPMYCTFRWDSMLQGSLVDGFWAAPKVIDQCSHFSDCPMCVHQPTCGWCSVDVYYGENQGKQCAGWNIDKTKDPFICPGTYSTVDCTPPPPPPTPPPAPTYLCNGTSKTCFETLPGHGTSKYVCEQTCGVHPIPSNSTPGELRGVWRGIQIHKNYTKGEWTLKVPETDSNVVLFIDPWNNQWTGNLYTVAGGGQLWIQALDGPNQGLWIKALWALDFGEETKFFTWAWGIPNPDKDTYTGLPADFNEAMDTPGMSEWFWISCLDDKEKENICNFSQ